MSATLRLAEQLIARRSLTPDDGGCQALIAERLVPLGFECTSLPFGADSARVTNLWADRGGSSRPGKRLVFAGHTDVVPTGPLSAWHSDPFVPTHRDGFLYGRGAADMKSSIAAMVVAAEEFVGAHCDAAGAISFLITSDEEGPSTDGTKRVCDWLADRATTLDYCIVGEPTSVNRLGDMIKNGRRGTLSGKLQRARACRGTSLTRISPGIRFTSRRRCSPSWSAWSNGTRGNAHFPPTSAGRCRTSTPAPAPATSFPGEIGDRLQLPLQHRVDGGSL